MPNSITVEYTAGSFISAANFTPTVAEKEEMQEAMTGTYVLDYFTYFPIGIFGLPACALYRLILPPTFTTQLDFYWFCNNDGSANTVRLDSDFCGTGPLVGGIENFFTNPVATFTGELPSITDYCDGEDFSASLEAQMLFAPATSCPAQPSASSPIAVFDVTIDISI